MRDDFFPPFGEFTPVNAAEAVNHQIAENRAAVDALVAAPPADAVVCLRALEAIGDKLNRLWSPVSHLNSVCNSDELRTVYEVCLQQLTDYSTDMGQHQGLFNLYQSIQASANFQQLPLAARSAVELALRNFRLAGIDLPAEQRVRFKAIKERLSSLANTFSNHVLDATQSWHYHTDKVEDLAGLPESALAQAAQAAEQKQLSGWVVTLDFPSYLAVMTYADQRELREQVYTAYGTRASEFGDAAFDNGPLIVEILTLRQELANLLDFDHYAALSLAKKMADSPAQVLDFLHDLARESKPVAEQEFVALSEFARTELGLTSLEPWDVSYVSEKLKQRDYAVSQEMLRPFFPAQRVVDGMFAVVKKLFGIDVAPVAQVSVWHPDVQVYSISIDNEVRAYFYLDLYARSKKRGGAWMDECRVRRQTEQGIQLPVAYLTCNFTPPLKDRPSLLTFDEVTTLFHEFGHGLHHMLTQMDVAAVSGINGVAWDAVELPSQFLENWCWEKSVVPLISGHYQTGETLPDELLEKMLAAKHFNAGMFMVRQLEFALFDFELHSQTAPENAAQVQRLLESVRQSVAVVMPPASNRFQNSFSHIFAGGYAAGYYSYKWAEVLSADAFSLFEENGVFDSATGAHFRDTVLAFGGAVPAAELFSAFRGRAPSVEPLLRHSGIRRVA